MSSDVEDPGAEIKAGSRDMVAHGAGSDGETSLFDQFNNTLKILDAGVQEETGWAWKNMGLARSLHDVSTRLRHWKSSVCWISNIISKSSDKPDMDARFQALLDEVDDEHPYLAGVISSYLDEICEMCKDAQTCQMDATMTERTVLQLYADLEEELGASIHRLDLQIEPLAVAVECKQLPLEDTPADLSDGVRAASLPATPTREVALSPRKTRSTPRDKHIYHPKKNPHGYHAITSPYMWHPRENPFGYHTDLSIHGYHPELNPIGYHPDHNIHGYHPEGNPSGYHPIHNPQDDQPPKSGTPRKPVDITKRYPIQSFLNLSVDDPSTLEGHEDMEMNKGASPFTAQNLRSYGTH